MATGLMKRGDPDFMNEIMDLESRYLNWPQYNQISL